MYLKRKVVAPFFRIPNPSNPITGHAEYLHPPLKPYVRFKLTEALATSDEIVKGEITDKGQWGPNPIFHDSNVIIYVHNQLAEDDQTYLFSGSIGDVGIALHDYANHWRIITLGPPVGLVELCAQEAATRNEPYHCLLGMWNPATNLWCYDSAPTVHAIDHRIGPPTADTGMKGLYQRMSSSVSGHNGVIYLCVSLDCEVPPEGCNLSEGA